jgi:hypothetical protein
MSRRRLLPLLACVVALPMALASCTFVPGSGFATVSHAEVVAAFHPGDRGTAADGVLTDLGYLVQVDLFELELEQAVLLELTGGAHGAFDPADPPPGYSSCHGGHCHAADGSLVSYAEIEVELAGDAAALTPVVTLGVEAIADLLTGEPLHAEVGPSVELPMVELRQLEVEAHRLVLEATVSGGPEGGELAAPVALRVDLEGHLRFGGGVDLDVDRDSAPELDLIVELPIDGALFDHLDWSALATDGAIELTDPEDEAATELIEHLLANLPALHGHGEEHDHVEHEEGA